MAEQATLRRKAIKKLEKLEVESLPDQLRRTQRQNVKRSTSRHPLRMAVARNIELRAAAVRLALERAGGIFFPTPPLGTRRYQAIARHVRTCRPGRFPETARNVASVEEGTGDAW
jgi:hypothetical protein